MIFLPGHRVKYAGRWWTVTAVMVAGERDYVLERLNEAARVPAILVETKENYDVRA